jgi:diguanylate cyclase (GGDEF)-like protein
MKKFDRAAKYTFAVLLIVIVFNLLFGYVLTKSATKVIRRQIDDRMLDVSNTAASMLNGDALAKISKDDYGSKEYQEVMHTLTYFQNSIELDYIYCIIHVQGDEFIFGVDPTIEDPAEFGAPVVCTDALVKASKGHASVDKVPYEDEWGSFYSAYSPVYDSSGKVTGIVAVDFDADWYQSKVRGLLTIVGVFIVFALVGGITIALLVARQYRRVFLGLVDRMNELSHGIDQLIHQVDPNRSDEDYSKLVYIERRGVKDVMELLTEKIHLMQEQLGEQIKQIRSHAYIDGLTGMQNRTSYTEYLQQVEKKIEEKTPYVFSVVVFDLNQLKYINDVYGHEAGDRLIIAIAKDICRIFGEKRVWRIGGDEFVCILEDAEPSELIRRLKENSKRRNDESPVLHDPDIEISIAVGASTFDREKDRTYSEVFHRADDAMYADKEAFYKTHKNGRRKVE